MKDELVKELEAACWVFYHRHIGTINHVTTKQRIYEIADKLQKEYGFTLKECEQVCQKAMA